MITQETPQVLRYRNRRRRRKTGILTSGMASSPGGILEIAHLVTPVSGQELSPQLAVFHEDNYFQRDILLVPGVKSAPPQNKAALPGLGEQMTRGKNGSLRHIGLPCPPKELPGGRSWQSHPDVHLRRGVVVDLFSTIAGKLWEVLSHHAMLR